jgi:LacI family transcriptional regulator
LTKKKKHAVRRQHANVTATDVARLAGVSPMTVSRVINDEGSVRESTREAVNRAIRELGYSPNKAARSLASASPIKIALLYYDPSSTFLSAMLIGVLEQARSSDTQIVVVACADGPEINDVIDGLVEDGVDGMILAPPLCDSRIVFAKLKEIGIPAVTVGSRHDELHISSVSIDDHLAASILTQHLIGLGHQRIAFLIGSAGQSASQYRLAGFKLAMENAGLEVHPELVIQGEFSYRSGMESAEKLLSLEHPPTAVLASNDDMAAGVISCAHRHHLDVPEDLTVCGFDDSMIATTIWPEITTVRQPIAMMSKQAIEILETSIRRQRSGLESGAQRLEMDFTLVQRNSDAPPLGAKGAATANRRIARRYSSASSRKPSA